MYINLKNGPKVVAVLLLVLLMGACKKKADNGFSIAGKYRVVRYAATDTLVNYYLFNSDKTFTYLHQSDDGSHDVSSGVYQLDEPAVIFSGSIGVALVSKSGDTLKLIKDATKPDSNSDNLILVADAAAPSAADWVTDVSVLTKVPVPDINISSVTFFSSNIWTCYQYEKRLKSYTLTGNEIDVVTMADEYYGLEGVGGNLWGVKINSDKLVRINPLNGNILFTSAAAPNEMHVITSDGARIYGYNINNSTMFSYSIAGDNFTGTHNFSADIRDMASLGAYLYGSSYNYIYKIDLNTLKIIKTYRVKDVDGVSGIFSDGTSLWIYVNDGLYEPGFFGKLNLN